MTAATAAAVDAGHKVRGGSALSVALARASPAEAPGYTTSPADSPGLPASLPASCGAGWLSSSLGSTQPASPAVGSCGTAVSPASQQQGAQPPHGGAQAQQQQQKQRVAAQPPSQSQPHAAHSRSRLLPFLGACFGGGSLPHSDSSVRPQPAVSASEVGIRPCFYWLHEDGPGGMNEAERMCAEANARWLKSDCQDDAVVIEHFGGLRHQTFAGVFDGHGPYGRAAAKFASTRLPQLLAAKAGAGAASERKRLRAMREAFLEVHAAMQDISQAGFDASLSGTTACCVLVVGRKVLVASTGDSRCVVARRKLGSHGHSHSLHHSSSGSQSHGHSSTSSGGCGAADGSSDVEVVPLTWDAKPSLPEEEKRIAQSGGVVKQLLDEHGERVGAFRVFSRGDDVLPGLAMSRSLGDLYAHEVGVSPEPILNTYTLGERDLFLLLATDGLWDIMGNEQAADFVERYKSRRDVHVSCAEALTLEAQERWKALHNEAIVDDISCVILHTCGLPPPERDCSVPRPLARAASCNDEANELYWKWQREKERNPSNHRPKQYFKHLYGEEEDGGAAEAEPAVPAVAAVAKPQRVQQVAPVEDAVPQRSTGRAAPAAAEAAASAAAAAEAPVAGGAPPPTSPALVRDALQACSSSSLAGAVPPALPSPAFRSSLRTRSPPGELGSSGALHRMDDLSSQSPHSSFGDLASENSEPSMRRGFTYLSGAWGSDSAPALNRRGSSGPQPIPGKQRHSFGGDGGALSLPLDSLLRPVRKAYPSTSNMQQLSYRSDGSFLAAETPRSGDGGELERKVRGGMSRSLSHACGLSSPLPASLPAGAACHAQASLLAWERSTAGRRSASSLAERGASSSSLGSPGGESVLLEPPSAPLSPQQSPLALAMGGGYSRVMVQPPAQQHHGPTRVQSVPFVHEEAAVPAAGAAGAALELRTARVVEVRAEMVQRGTHLSRTTTDTAGLVQAVDLLARAAAAAGMASGP